MNGNETDYLKIADGVKRAITERYNELELYKEDDKFDDEITPEQLPLETPLKDLGLDSLDITELLIDMEDDPEITHHPFSLPYDDKRLDNPTVQEIIKYIVKQIEESEV